MLGRSCPEQCSLATSWTNCLTNFLSTRTGTALRETNSRNAVDTCVLIYRVDRSDLVKQVKARELL